MHASLIIMPFYTCVRCCKPMRRTCVRCCRLMRKACVRCCRPMRKACVRCCRPMCKTCVRCCKIVRCVRSTRASSGQAWPLSRQRAEPTVTNILHENNGIDRQKNLHACMTPLYISQTCRGGMGVLFSEPWQTSLC